LRAVVAIRQIQCTGSEVFFKTDSRSASAGVVSPPALASGGRFDHAAGGKQFLKLAGVPNSDPFQKKERQ